MDKVQILSGPFTQLCAGRGKLYGCRGLSQKNITNKINRILILSNKAVNDHPIGQAARGIMGSLLFGPFGGLLCAQNRSLDEELEFVIQFQSRYEINDVRVISVDKELNKFVKKFVGI